MYTILRTVFTWCLICQAPSIFFQSWLVTSKRPRFTYLLKYWLTNQVARWVFDILICYLLGRYLIELDRGVSTWKVSSQHTNDTTPPTRYQQNCIDPPLLAVSYCIVSFISLLWLYPWILEFCNMFVWLFVGHRQVTSSSRNNCRINVASRVRALWQYMLFPSSPSSPSSFCFHSNPLVLWQAYHPIIETYTS